MQSLDSKIALGDQLNDCGIAGDGQHLRFRIASNKHLSPDGRRLHGAIERVYGTDNTHD